MPRDAFLIVLPLSIFLLSLLWWRAGRRSQDPALWVQGLSDCALLLRLLALLQKHRGASSAWLSGDAALGERRRALQAEIDALWPAFAVLARRENAQVRPCFTVNDGALFHFRWARMLEGLAGSSAAEAMLAHTQMINRLLDWLAALGEARLAAGAEAKLAGRVNDYAHRLPALAECLGQARALGSAAAAAGQCAPVARVRLGFLLARAESLLAAACRADQSTEAGQAQQAVVRLLEILRQDLLAASPPRVSAQTCFAVATEAIDGVFAWIDAQGGMLQVRRGARGIAQPVTAI